MSTTSLPHGWRFSDVVVYIGGDATVRLGSADRATGRKKG
jgi:hypothetical protein